METRSIDVAITRIRKKIEQDQAKADQQRLDSKKKEGAEKFLELETEILAAS